MDIDQKTILASYIHKDINISGCIGMTEDKNSLEDISSGAYPDPFGYVPNLFPICNNYLFFFSITAIYLGSFMLPEQTHIYLVVY